MATVGELSAPYSNFMLRPLPPSTADVCQVCLTFTEGGWATCYPCGHQARFADGVVPISYSVAYGQLHTALQQYKRARPAIARPIQMQLAAVLWRFLLAHEACVARYVGVDDAFDVVTTVPSSDAARDAAHPLPRIVGELIGATRDRYRRLLVRSGTPVASRTVDLGTYSPSEDLGGESVLLVDDTWTTGANA